MNRKATAEQLWDFFVWLHRHPRRHDVFDLFDEEFDIDAHITKALLEEYERESQG